ncbi:MAG: TlpA family protein disulfide reductase, partial [Flavobacteriaceae bacterium]
VAFEELMKIENQDHHEKFLQQFLLVNTSKSYLKEVLDLHNDIENMSAGKILPELKLQDHLLNTVSTVKLIDKPTVFYFWSQTQMSHYRSTVIKAKALKKRFPKYEFKGICIQPFNEIVFEVYRMMNIDPKTQLAFVNFDKDSKKWVLSLLNRAIVVDANGKIKEGFGNFSAPDFEDLLH